MSHFAKVENGTVTQVIVAEQDVIDTGIFGHNWIQTSYNTIGNKHTLGGTPLRGNYAGIGYIYNDIYDVFYSPSPYPSWVLNHSTWTWEAPIAAPVDDKQYTWEESTTSWIEVPPKA